MINAFATILLILTILLGSGGATVAAAQTSQPDQPFYALKIWSEDVRLSMAADPQSETRLALEFSDRRAAEMTAMFQNGMDPAESVQIRYQSQVERAIQNAVNLPEDLAIQALVQVKTRLQKQQQEWLAVNVKDSPQREASIAQIRQMLQERLHWVEMGMAEPTRLRDQLRLRDQQQNQLHQGTSTPAEHLTQAATGAGSGNPWTTGTPTPGSGYGPGNGACDACTPALNGEGQNPWTTGTPTPNSGYGPGPGPTPSLTFAPGSGPQATPQLKNQSTQVGPQPTQAQNSRPTQAGSQPTDAPGGPKGKP